MAQLKDSVVQGSLRVTDTTYTNSLVVGDASTPTIAADYLMMVDTSDGNKVIRGPLFDGSTETSILTKKGTWVSVEGTSPISVSASGGKITVSLSSSYCGSQTKNTVFAAPSTANGAPAFRTLVAADMPVATTAAKGAIVVGDTLGISNEILNVKYGTAASTSLQGNQNLFTLNNSAKNAAANASIYAPTTGGTAGYVLGSAGGTNAPVWSNKGNGRVFYGTCATAATELIKQVVCDQYDQLVIGDILIVRFTVTNNAGPVGVKIQIIDQQSTAITEAMTIKCQIVKGIGDLPEKGYLLPDRPYMFVYDGTYWVLMNINRDNDNNTIAYQTRYSQSVFTLDNTTGGAGRTLNRYKIMLQKPDGQLTPVSTKGNTTAANDETIYDGEFLINGEILYYSNTSAVSPGTAIGASYLWKQVDLNLAYSFNTGSTLIAGKPVYLVAKPTYVDSPYATLYKNNTWSNMAINATTGEGAGCITQNLDLAKEGYIYIHLGYAYNTTNITLSEKHPVYQCATAYQIKFNQSICKVDSTNNIAVQSARLLLETDEGTFVPIFGTNADNEYTGQFLMQGKILYYDGTATINPGETIPANDIWKMHLVDLSTFNYVNSGGYALIPGRPVYLTVKPTFYGSRHAVLFHEAVNVSEERDSDGYALGLLTQSFHDSNFNTKANNLVYIRLGTAYDTTHIILDSEHPCYSVTDQGAVPYGNSIIRPSVSSTLGYTFTQLREYILRECVKLNGGMSVIHFYVNPITTDWTNVGIYEAGKYAGILNSNPVITDPLNPVENDFINGTFIFWKDDEFPSMYTTAIKKSIYVWSFLRHYNAVVHWKYETLISKDQGIVKTFSISPSEWLESANNVTFGGDSNYYYSVNLTTETNKTLDIEHNNIITSFDSSCMTASMYDAISEAKLVTVNVSNNLIIRAYGELPTETLYLALTVLGPITVPNIEYHSTNLDLGGATS